MNEEFDTLMTNKRDKDIYRSVDKTIEHMNKVPEAIKFKQKQQNKNFHKIMKQVHKDDDFENS